MKNFYRFIFIVIACITIAGTSHSETYYVNAATGNDNNSATLAKNISTPWLTVQRAINDAGVAAGDNIVVAEGTYPGFTLTKRLTIIGAWKDSSSSVNTIFNSIIDLQAPGGSINDRMHLKNLRVSVSTTGDAMIIRQGYLTLENVFATSSAASGNGVRFSGASLKDINFESCNFNNNTYAGLFFPTTTGVDGLVIRNSSVSNNGYFGILAFQSRTNPTEIINVEISHCVFIDNNPTNQSQGHSVYFEKLKNALIENVSVVTPPNNTRIGIDINLLSREDYTNITIRNSRIIRSTPGSGIWIQARNDLFNPPARLDTVMVQGVTFTGCDTNLAFNRQVKNMNVDKCDLSTYSVYGLVNYTDQGGTIDASDNKWKNGGIPDTTVISGGLLTQGNNIISFMPSTDGIFIGMGILGPGIAPGATVVGKSPNTIVMSDTALASGFIPQIGFAFNFATSTNIVRTSLNFVHTPNPLPNSIINSSNVSFPDVPSAIAGTSAGGTIWNIPNATIPGNIVIDRDLKLIGPGAGFLHGGSLTTFTDLTVNTGSFFFMGSDFAVSGSYTPGTTTIGANNTLMINGSIVSGGQIIGGSKSDMFFGGAGPSTTLGTVSGGLRTLQLNRPSGISLGASLLLQRLLFLQNGNLLLENNDLVLDSRISVFSPDYANSFVATNGPGVIRKNFDTKSVTSFNFPIGRGSYTPAFIYLANPNYGIGSHIIGRVLDLKHPQNGCPTDFLNRYWELRSAAMGFTANTKFTYATGDVAGTEANIVGARWNGFLWDAFTPVNTVTHSFTANGINSLGDFTGGGLNCIGGSNTLVNAKVFLQGSYSGSDTMRTDLQQYGIIPLSQPYSSSQFNYPGTESVLSIPAGVVDWVYVEIRVTSNGPPVLNGRRAAFLKSDGSIVDLDGTSPVKMPSVATGNYFIVIGQRNHLPVMTASAQPLGVSSPLYDFTTGLSQYFGGDAASLGGGKFGMYSGDANASFVVSAADYQIVSSNLLQTNYNQGDLNLSAIVSSADYAFITNNLLKTSNVPNYP